MANDFKPFATGPGANVTKQADWENLPALLSGFVSGKASAAQINKALRQASFIAAALAQYTADKSGEDVLDDGDIAGFIAKMSAAFGEDFQPKSEKLTAFSGLAGAANRLPYFTGANALALTALTAAGRDLIGKADVPAILEYLGLGGAAKLNVGTTAGTVAAGDDSRFGKMIGIGQTWQNVTSQRVYGVTYTNTTGRPIQMLLDFARPTSSAWNVAVTLDGISVSGAGSYCPIIPPGGTYSVSASGILSMAWRELR